MSGQTIELKLEDRGDRARRRRLYPRNCLLTARVLQPPQLRFERLSHAHIVSVAHHQQWSRLASLYKLDS
eukprot:scaffold104943_cov31-Tisochrysis_lutea.AAC.3